MKTLKKFVATYNFYGQYKTNQYRFGHALITSLEEFKKFCFEQCFFKSKEERIETIYNQIQNGDYTLWAGKNYFFAGVGGSCNPELMISITEELTTPYVFTTNGNIVAMINGVETYINPKTGINNPVEKPCFYGIASGNNVHFVENGSVESILEKVNADINKEKARVEAQLAELKEPCKGWYVVTLTALVSVTRGNDGKRTYSYRVLAESQFDAFEKASAALYNKMPKGVDFIYHITDSVFSALIEFVGIWTDTAELEYGTTV